MMKPELDYRSVPWLALDGLPPDENDDDRISTDQLDYLSRCLQDLPSLAVDLEIAASRQDRFPSRPTPITDGTESPLPYRQGALRSSERLAFEVWSVTSLVWHRATQGQPQPFRSALEAGDWLRSQLRVFAQDPEAIMLARRITDAHDAALNGPIERPPEWRYLGPCPICRCDLAVHPGAVHVTCEECGWTAETATVIAQALAVANDLLFTAAQLVGALELDGRMVTRDQVDGWRRRGRLVGHQHRYWSRGSRGEATIVTVWTYRLSEVRELLGRTARRD